MTFHKCMTVFNYVDNSTMSPEVISESWLCVELIPVSESVSFMSRLVTLWTKSGTAMLLLEMPLPLDGSSFDGSLVSMSSLTCSKLNSSVRSSYSFSFFWSSESLYVSSFWMQLRYELILRPSFILFSSSYFTLSKFELSSSALAAPSVRTSSPFFSVHIPCTSLSI